MGMAQALIGKSVALILLADDSEQFAQSIGASLRKMGHEVVIAYNGLEALEATQRQAFDLMVLDAVMPEMDGMELCRLLRAISEGSRPEDEDGVAGSQQAAQASSQAAGLAWASGDEASSASHALR